MRANERVDEGTMCMSANVVANLSNNLKDTFMKSMFVFILLFRFTILAQVTNSSACSNLTYF